MAKVRVSTLAKEFGMTSKELMGHLADMKIPAKSASSALEDAYVAMVRKQLASVIEARAKEVEAAKQAEEEALAPLKEKLNATLTAVGKEKGYAFIFNTDNNSLPYVNELMGENINALLTEKLK